MVSAQTCTVDVGSIAPPSSLLRLSPPSSPPPCCCVICVFVIGQDVSMWIWSLQALVCQRVVFRAPSLIAQTEEVLQACRGISRKNSSSRFLTRFHTVQR